MNRPDAHDLSNLLEQLRTRHAVIYYTALLLLAFGIFGLLCLVGVGQHPTPQVGRPEARRFQRVGAGLAFDTATGRICRALETAEQGSIPLCGTEAPGEFKPMKPDELPAPEPLPTAKP